MKKDPKASAAVAGARLIHRPWGTLITVLLALAVFLVPSSGARLGYDRALILEGEWWRCVTGNWVHFSGSHLFWNLVVLLPTGIWLEGRCPRRARLLYVSAPIAIGAVLLALDPALSRYAGLSGIASGVVALLALSHLASSPNDRWFWRAVLGLIALKIVAEMLVGRPYFARFVPGDVYAVPLAHLTGVACACFLRFRGQRLPL
ncbi:MAG TPA: rhombosortase [Opitutaceae bacterium]|nr:rhombosortase [Opitutaceae bacterium]